MSVFVSIDHFGLFVHLSKRKSFDVGGNFILGKGGRHSVACVAMQSIVAGFKLLLVATARK